ncbi:MAG: dynamin family protein, partial [Cytophagales bacterium]|nr:dynamin family protein [Cytophagales bacterium]
LINESPLLVDAVRGFIELDQVAYRLGLLNKTQSFATQIPWWPLITVLGTDTLDKSNFLKSYLGDSIVEDESQDSDEKFTVYCYANGDESRILPGIALDADPRFPFYQISDELEKLSPGNGANVNNCLQLKTNSSAQLQGYTYVDVPSFRSGTQCAETLTLTDHIIDVSDLVLVFV